MTEIEHCFFVIAFDRKDLLENSLEPLILPLRKRDVLLEKIDV
jgi:hypothetical protein